MKYTYPFIFCLLICILLSYSVKGQLNGGIKLGWEFENDLTLPHTFKSGDSLVLMSIKPKTEGHLGLWTGFSQELLFIQVELLLNQTQERYIVGVLNTPSSVEKVTAKRFFFELPILIGSSYDFINGYVGIAPRISINQPHNLNRWYSIHRNQADFNLKYIIGLGLKLGRLGVDFRYNNRILSYNDQFILNGHSMKLIDHIERFSISTSIGLF